MKLSTLTATLTLSALSFITFTAAHPSAYHHPHPSLPFSATCVFTATLSLGIPTDPIPVTGGVRVVEPILDGTVTGPYFNGTIEQGLATPLVINNQTIQVPFIELYGQTNDGEPFYLHEAGIGSPQAQVTRIVLEIGGGQKYETLRNAFILATVNPTKDRKTVVAQGFLIDNTFTL